MADKPRIDEVTGTPTVGHEWDGIEELDTPMPRWWLYTLYATILFSIGYMILYPAWPLLNSATRGVLGWSSRGDYNRDVAAEELRQAPVREALSRIAIERLDGDSRLMQASVEGGRAAFKVHCVQCHGAGAAYAAAIYRGNSPAARGRARSGWTRDETARLRRSASCGARP